jgi:hypothetical protein
MSQALLEERPAYVEFETRAIEDREATIEQGYWVGKDVDYAVITPPGGSLVVERNAEEWFAQLAQQGSPFLAVYERAYRAWKDQEEIPIEGTAIKTWAAISPSDIARVIKANVRTVEDLARAPEAALTKMGMGARALQEKAKAWLETADQGKVAEELAALRARLDDLENDNERLTEDKAELEKALLEAKPAVRAGTTKGSRKTKSEDPKL